MTRRWCAVYVALAGAAAAWGMPPAVFFTDLTSGPNKGGQNDAGAFVTLYGRNFGAARRTSSVSVGGGPVASYALWSDTKIAIQLGAAAVTGNIIVTTAAGVSTGAPFTVQSGNIYFVSPNGSDGNNGKYNSPWLDLDARARHDATGRHYLRDEWRGADRRRWLRMEHFLIAEQRRHGVSAHGFRGLSERHGYHRQ